jgi:8-oxo-dGTP pyrophosphatase MutT (NUDIX family)
MKKINKPKSINKVKISEIGIFKTMVVSGPVVVQKKDGKWQLLLVKHGDKTVGKLKWKFCGGKLLKGWSLKNNAIREAKEEIGINVKIIADLPIWAIWKGTPDNGQEKPELIILVHYLAEIRQEPKQGREILAMRWFDINKLPVDCAPNIRPIVKAAKYLLVEKNK